MCRNSLAGVLVWALALAVQAQDQAADLLARGAALIASKPADAVKVLREAVQLDPNLPGLRYQLGLAYHAVGDEADAAAEFREALDRTPESAAAHNYLGIALFQHGDVKAALAEFREAVRLAPKDANAHFNLGEALARTGESAAAVEELRVATGLAPSDNGLARLLETVETKLAAADAIKVEVRQVLVPVVVTDREGHRMTGLKQDDFHVFEDGVEQTLTSFSAESSGVPETANGGVAAVAPAPVAAPAAGKATRPAASAVAPRRTYMVVIDTLHTRPAGLSSAREALVQLFQQERAADSQYALITLGEAAQVVVNITSDPATVLGALDDKHFRKIVASAQMGSLNADLERFRRDLVDIRYACDQAPIDQMMKIKCAQGVERNFERAQQLAEFERLQNTDFLGQLRSLVAQLARAHDRRTIILVSDGFSVEPGRTTLSLFDAFFPAAANCRVPAGINCPKNVQILGVHMSEEFDPILKLAAGANVAIDTIDSRGLYGPAGFDASSAGNPPSVDGAVTRTERNLASAQGDVLVEMASATGGVAHRNSNNLLSGLRRAFADGRDYYLLSYVSTNSVSDGKFRAISVKVKDAKAVVTAKRGYWAADQ